MLNWGSAGYMYTWFYYINTFIESCKHRSHPSEPILLIVPSFYGQDYFWAWLEAPLSATYFAMLFHAVAKVIPLTTLYSHFIPSKRYYVHYHSIWITHCYFAATTAVDSLVSHSQTASFPPFLYLMSSIRGHFASCAA